MKEYADFLIDNRNRRIKSSRLTRQFIDDNLFGGIFGDCHADQNGGVGKPYSGHVHIKRDDWKRDNTATHLILFSSEFCLWEIPGFAARRTIGQSGHGYNLRADNLELLLKKV